MSPEGENGPGLPEELLAVALRLAKPFELSEVLHLIVDTGCEVLDADRASLLLFDRERGELYSQATSERESIRFPADQGIAGETLAGRQLIRIDDCYADPRFNPEVDRATGYRTANMISIPLVGVDAEPVGVMQLLNAKRGRFEAGDERLAEAFAGFAALAIQRAQAFEDRLRAAKVERDLDLAREIQTGLLPGQLPDVAGYELASFSRPAEETGGDIFDLAPLRTGENAPLLLLLADATGHGVGAALSVTQVRSMMRIATRLEAGLDELCLHLNNQLVDDLPSNKFVTAFFGILDPERHTIDYRSLGQAPLLHYRAERGGCRSLDASGPPMGLLPARQLAAPEPLRLEPGDLFVLLSDGFYEYENPGGEMFGRGRVEEILASQASVSAEAVVGKLLERLDRFANGAPQADDLTALVVRRP